MNRPLQAVGGSFSRAHGSMIPAVALAALLALTAFASTVFAAPFIWDQDDDRMDDRMETVHLFGYAFSFENADTLDRQRIEVDRESAGLVYGVYVVYDHVPTATDLASLTLLGMPALHRFESIEVVRSVATFAQAQGAATLAGVERIEAIPVLYPELREGVADIAARDAGGHVFPTWAGTGGSDGTGSVIAFLDTGINDAPDGAYPGHESLIGRCLGGAEFTHGDSIADTPRNGSINPVDRGGAVTHAHGTHVAGIALGTGGASGYAAGVAPGARYLDVKVLNDLGVGTGVSEAIDWCIHNRSRDWGVPGFDGVDVINLSLSSTDETDGRDVASRLADRAAAYGIVVVASTGNEGRDHYVPSPAGGAAVLAVGAMDDQRTGLPGDDGFAAFSDYGPRADDGDGDPSDELKPDLLAPGVAVLSADGDLASDGAQYRRLSGTSMAAAFVSGVAAALRASYPGLTPADLAELLRATARRQLVGGPAGTTGSDPRWASPRGFGVVDLHAAKLELDQPGRSQVDRIELAGAGSQITAVLRTQRELGVQHFVFERAPDVSGNPGSFAAVDSVPATGGASLATADNRESYTRIWSVPASERGVTHWYRVSWTEGGARYDSPARAFTSPWGPAAATFQVTIVHNAYDHDLTGALSVGGSPSGPAGVGGGSSRSESAWSIPLPGTSAADSSNWVTGVSAAGNVEWSYHVDVPSGVADAFLPPSAANPWWLRVNEGGYLNRSGGITRLRLVWHSPGGDVVYEGGPVPRQMLEGSTTYAAVPQGTAGVEEPAMGTVGRFGPNPVQSGRSVAFRLPATLRGQVLVYDLAGREIGGAPIFVSNGASLARWEARDGAGRPLPSGVYLVRAGNMALGRLVVIKR